MAKLSATDRRDIRKLMEDKEKQLTQALGNEISSDITQIKARLLLKAGFQFNSTQMKRQMSDLDEQRRELISTIDNSERSNDLELLEATFENEFEAETLAVQLEYQAKKEELDSWRTSKKDSLAKSKKNHMEDISNRKNTFNEDFIRMNHPNLLSDFSNAREQYEKVNSYELSIQSEARRIAIHEKDEDEFVCFNVGSSLRFTV